MWSIGVTQVTKHVIHLPTLHLSNFHLRRTYLEASLGETTQKAKTANAASIPLDCARQLGLPATRKVDVKRVSILCSTANRAQIPRIYSGELLSIRVNAAWLQCHASMRAALCVWPWVATPGAQQTKHVTSIYHRWQALGCIWRQIWAWMFMRFEIISM